MSRRRAIIVTAVFLTGMIGCGGGTPLETSADDVASESASIAPADGSTLDNCVEEPRADLGLEPGWTVCADSGLIPPTDGFGFENWGGPPTSDAYTPSLAVSMFGEKAVCLDTSNGCVLHPAAQQWIDQMNLAIQGGRCEGMAVLSQRFLEGRDDVSSFQAGASATSELSRDEVTVGTSIARWWASQTFPAVRAATSPTLEWEPLDIAARVAEALRDGEGATIGLYSEVGAHAITPIAVSTDGATTVVIHVYDNNYPGRILPVFIDRASGEWTYDMAATNAGVDSEVWSGGVGTMDLTLMDEREVAVPAPWTDDSDMKGATVLTVSTGGASAAGVELDFSGEVLDSRNVLQKRDGVSVYPFRGARRGTGAVIVIEARAGAFSAKPVIGEVLDDSTTTVRMVLTVDLPGKNSTQIDGSYEETDFEALPSIYVDATNDDPSMEIDGDGSLMVDVAYGDEGYEFDLEGDVDFSFEESGDEGDLSLLDDQGNSIWEDSSDGENADGEFTETSIDYDAETGILEESSIEAESYELDVELLTWILDTLQDVLDDWVAVLGDGFAEFFGDEFIEEFTSILDDIEAEIADGDDEDGEPESDDGSVPEEEPSSEDEPSESESPTDEPESDEILPDAPGTTVVDDEPSSDDVSDDGSGGGSGDGSGDVDDDVEP